MPPPSQTDTTSEDASRARSIADVLCREVGARHPDGALKQIRTMKRLLRAHYRVQQRLEAHGVDRLEDAVSRIAALTRQVEQLRIQQRRQARRRLTIIESLLDRMDAVRTPPDSSPENAPDGTPIQEALDLVDALTTELDELRLELWIYRSDDPTASDPDAGTTATDLLSRLDEALQNARDTARRLHRERVALQDENERLRRETERLRATVDEQQRRIQQLEEDTNRSSLAPTDP